MFFRLLCSPPAICVFLLYITILPYCCIGVSNISKVDMQSLRDLYSATNGPDWDCCLPLGTVAWNFTDSSNPCTDNWQGIRCEYNSSSLSYVIVEINLDFRIHEGTLPDSIGNFNDVTYLNLRSDELTGQIPTSIGDMSILEYLYLYNTSLTGSIPSVLGNVSSLISLYLMGNKLTGTIPSSLTQLENLEYFYLYENCLHGTLPSELGRSVIYFDVESNQLTGTLPDSYGNLSNLQELFVGSNFLTGSVPNCWGNLSHLTSLTANNNYFTGTLPNSLGSLYNITELLFYFNDLTGTIPSSYGKLVNMVSFYLDSNSLSGTIPPSLGRMNVVHYFYLSINYLTGSIPSSLGNMSHCEYFVIPSNQLTGTVPVSLSQLSALQQFVVKENELSGSLDGLFDNDTQLNLHVIELNNNQLTGTLPSSIFNLKKLTSFIGYTNCFHGTLPSSICGRELLETLVLDGMSSATSCRTEILPWLSTSYIFTKSVGGELPLCLFSLTSLSSMHLSGNGFYGNPLEDVDILSVMTDLDLSHNFFTGTIGTTVQSKIWLSLDVSFNKLTGTASDFVEQNSSTFIGLENNRLSGRIPSSLFNLLNVSILGSNIYFCGGIESSGQPPNDSDNESYECASKSFNFQFYAWGALVLMCGGGIAALWWTSSDKGDAKGFDYQGTVRRFQSWLQYTAVSTDSTVPVALMKIGKIFRNVLWLTALCTFYITVVFVPLYVLLSMYYGTYSYEYAYSFSAAFISGVPPFSLELSCFISFLAIVAFSFKYLDSTHENVENKMLKNDVSDETPLPLSDSLFYIISCIYVLLNLVFVLSINAAYVVSAIFGDSSLLILEQIMLSLFKVTWNRFNYLLLHIVGNLVSPGFSECKTVGVQFLYLQIVMATINNIFFPTLVVLVISPSCFYNVFVPPPEVSSTFTTSQCAHLDEEGQCVEMEEGFETATFAPPFTYSYQCSSSLVTYYAPIFVSMCALSSFVVPLCKVVLVLLHEQAVENTVWFRMLDTVLPPLLKPLPSEETYRQFVGNNSKEGKGSGPFFVASRSISLLSVLFGLLCTFGVMFPPLAVALALAIFVHIYTTKLELGRFLQSTFDRNMPKFREVLIEECEQIASDSILKSITWMLLYESCLFYSLFLFDTLGDAVGFRGSFWVLIVVPLLPVMLYAVVLVMGVSGTTGCNGVSAAHVKENEVVEVNRDTEMSRVSFNPLAAASASDSTMDA